MDLVKDVKAEVLDLEPLLLQPGAHLLQENDPVLVEAGLGEASAVNIAIGLAMKMT